MSRRHFHRGRFPCRLYFPLFSIPHHLVYHTLHRPDLLFSPLLYRIGHDSSVWLSGYSFIHSSFPPFLPTVQERHSGYMLCDVSWVRFVVVWLYTFMWCVCCVWWWCGVGFVLGESLPVFFVCVPRAWLRRRRIRDQGLNVSG